MSIATIEGAIATAVATMTVAGGYSFNWSHGTINPPDSDFERVRNGQSPKYPIADIFYTEEDCEDGDKNTLSVSNVVTFFIDVIPKNKDTTKEDIANCVRDFKKLMFNNYHLGGAFFWWYIGFKKFVDPLNTNRVHYGARIETKVRYRELRSNP